MSASAAPCVSFAVTLPTVTARRPIVTAGALRSSVRMSARALPSDAESTPPTVSMPKSDSVTTVEPRVRVMPPEWLIVPANVGTRTRPSVIVNASDAKNTPRNMLSMPCCAYCVQMATTLRESASEALATIFTEPSLRRGRNALTLKVALSAAAPAVERWMSTLETVVSMPGRVTRALPTTGISAMSRRPPLTRTDSVEFFFTATSKFERVRRVLPAESRMPPEWR